MPIALDGAQRVFDSHNSIPALLLAYPVSMEWILGIIVAVGEALIPMPGMASTTRAWLVFLGMLLLIVAVIAALALLNTYGIL